MKLIFIIIPFVKLIVNGMLSIRNRPRTVRIHRDLSADDIGRIIDEWERDVAAADSNSPVGMGALLYRLKNGVTPVDLAAVKQRAAGKYAIPDEYAGIIIG
jgi:hypothetical protein